MQVQAAVAESKGAPLVVQDLELDDELREREVLVRVVACAVCRADILARDQAIPFPLPGVLGHEGTGVVERVGPRVAAVRAGDHVIMSFPSDGTCRNCLRGRPRWCESGGRLMWSGRRLDGSGSALRRDGTEVGGHLFQQSAFASHVIATEMNVVAVPERLPLDRFVLGCGIMTGAGGVLNALRPGPGDSIVVFGAGGVGTSAVMAAKLANCPHVLVVEPHPGRCETARSLGATHTLDPRNDDVPERVRQITGHGAEFSLICTSDRAVLRQALAVLGDGGTCGVIGDPGADVDVSFEIASIIGSGKTIHGINGGEVVAQTFLPWLIEAHERGVFPFEKIIARYDFSDINTALRDSDTGTTIKPVLIMPG
ncbi:NAD(P)-dependent alcohol dehydrogenase [Streptomyces yanii]|uniref:NAD(P)-dependent alcohol dehydrogenase n=1 Tax=Streptomyces yanii TaxID=78510 RepID=A0ABV5R6J3_9ACTN